MTDNRPLEHRRPDDEAASTELEQSVDEMEERQVGHKVGQERHEDDGSEPAEPPD